MITSKDLVEEGSVSYRQVDYWIRTGVIPINHSTNVGSGYPRTFMDEDIVARVRLLGQISRSMATNLGRNGGGAVPTILLKMIYDCYKEGEVNLGNGIKLTWVPETSQKLQVV